MFHSSRRIAFHVLLGLSPLIAVACSSKPTVLPPSGLHTATDPAMIVIYQNPPNKYEKLGIVETTDHVRWEKDSDSFDPMMVDSLLAKAATLGATGLLLQVNEAGPGENLISATGKYRGQSYQFTGTQTPVKKAKAVAIYVLDR
jgi:hypothetical protein